MQQPLRHALLIFILVLTGSYGFAAKASANIAFEQKFKIILFACVIGAVVFIFERRLLKLAQAALPEAVAQAIKVHAKTAELQAKQNAEQAILLAAQSEKTESSSITNVKENEISQS